MRLGKELQGSFEPTLADVAPWPNDAAGDFDLERCAIPAWIVLLTCF
jgi:hypothetical protein